LYLVIYQDDLQIEFSIKNTYKKSNMSIGTLQRKNISTKKGHSGLGLNTIQEFTQKFPNVFTQYKQEESFFSVQLIIIK